MNGNFSISQNYLEKLQEEDDLKVQIEFRVFYLLLLLEKLIWVSQLLSGMIL